MDHWPKWRTMLLWAVLCLAAQTVAAFTVQINYTYDTNNFFGSGNPQGATGAAQAKAALQAAASFYSTLLTDTLQAITVPAPYNSNKPGSTSVRTWTWEERFQHPSDNSTNELHLVNPTVNANQYIVYVGARSLPAGIAGEGGMGGWARPVPIDTGSGGFTNGDNSTMNATTNSFDELITKRGKTSGIASWGGSISFDRDGSTPWFFDHLGTPSGDVTDFYSVALHELGHTLGVGNVTSTSAWKALVSGSTFVGINSENENDGTAVPLSPDLKHWVSGQMSKVYGTATPQEALMDPELLNGTRKKLTKLDAAALTDLGWSLGPVPGVNGDYNNNGIVDAGDYAVWRKQRNQNVTLPNDTTPGTVTTPDYTVWRNNFGKVPSGSGSGSLITGSNVPEPATGLLALVFGLIGCSIRNRIRC